MRWRPARAGRSRRRAPSAPAPAAPGVPGAVPTVAASTDTGSVQLGVKFPCECRRLRDGGSLLQGSGEHRHARWQPVDGGGVRLAFATFTNETATGWQQVTFAQPVAVTANTVYVVSYHAPNGRYSYDPDFFTSAGLTAGPLYLLRDGESGGNGVYVYGQGNQLPKQLILIHKLLG